MQRSQIERWAALRGVEIAAWHTDLDQTGGKLERPGLAQFMERLRAKETGGIVVARLDRLSRAGVGDALKLVEEIEGLEGRLAVVDLGIDPTTMFGEFAMTVMLALARMERRRIAESWQVAQERAIARGVHFRAPFGYTRGEDGRLVPDEHGPAVREIFRRRGAGVSWLELARYLDEAAPREGQWTRQTVSTMIQSRTYLGEAHHGEHRLPGAHEAIVSEAEWTLANQARGVRPSRGEFLLSGLVRCAGCSNRLVPTRLEKGRGARRIYVCRKRHSDGRCPAPAMVMADRLEAFVEREFLAEIEAFEIRGSTGGPALDELQRERDQAEAELAVFRDDLRVREALGTDQWVAGLEARSRALSRTEERLRQGMQTSTGIDLPAGGDAWGELSTAEKRRILTAAVDVVFLRRTGSAPIERRALVLFRGEGPPDLGRRSKGIVSFPWPDDPPRGLRVAGS